MPFELKPSRGGEFKAELNIFLDDGYLRIQGKGAALGFATWEQLVNRFDADRSFAWDEAMPNQVLALDELDSELDLDHPLVKSAITSAIRLAGSSIDPKYWKNPQWTNSRAYFSIMEPELDDIYDEAPEE